MSYETLLKLDGKIWQITSDSSKLFSAKHLCYTVYLVHTLKGHANLSSSLVLIMRPFSDSGNLINYYEKNVIHTILLSEELFAIYEYNVHLYNYICNNIHTR